MVYADLGFVNALLVHQTNRQKILETGLTNWLNELFWYASKVETISKNNQLTLTTIELLLKWRMLTAQSKIDQLRSKIDDMDLLEKQTLLAETYAELKLVEELLNADGTA